MSSARGERGWTLVALTLLAGSCQLHGPDARGPSTPAERAQFVADVRWVEANPLDERSSAARARLRQWTIEVPDIRFTVCPDLLGHALGDAYPYTRELTTQIALSGAILTIEHPLEAREDVAVYLAGLEGALRTYQVMSDARPESRTAALEDLLEKRRRGELRAHVASLAKEHCKKDRTRFVAVPIGAAVGLLIATLVARRFRPTNRGPVAHAIVRKVVLVCVVSYAIVGIALHVLEPEFDPRVFPMSQYAWGAYGWLMTSTFFMLATAIFTVAMALRNVGPSSRTSRIGLALPFSKSAS